MQPREKKRKLEKDIEIVIKKLNIFTINDMEILLEKPKLEIVPILEKLVSKNILKNDGNSYIYVPPAQKSKKKSSGKDSSENLIQTLPFQPKRPKEVYLRHINEIDGFVDYFFAPPKVKNNIKTMLKILKETHGLKGNKLKAVLEKYNITMKKYVRFKNEISKNGLVNLVGSDTREPTEIYYFFKEYYLSPKQYSAAEARELAIQRLERLIKMKINRGRITSVKTMNRWVQEEFTQKQIEKFRNINFSEFDTEKIFKE